MSELTPVSPQIPQLPAIWMHNTYTIRRKVFKIFGGAFHVYGPSGEVIGYSKQKAFKLREDIRIFTDTSCTTELLAILARQVIDFSASYDVVDSQLGQPVGTLRRKGFKSMFRDEWVLFDATGQEIGLIQEDSAVLALIRRFMANLIPQKFNARVGDQEVASFRQHFNPFVLKHTVSILPGADQLVDRRLLLAAGVLLNAIEGRQKN